MFNLLTIIILIMLGAIQIHNRKDILFLREENAVLWRYYEAATQERVDFNRDFYNASLDEVHNHIAHTYNKEEC